MTKTTNSIIKAFLLSVIMLVNIHFAYTQTASILPLAKTTFVDQNGKPLAGGTVDFYIPGTSTHKTTWQDAGQSTPNTNPVNLDGSGRALILGSGSYRQVVKDKDGNLVWDQITASAASGGGGGGTSATVGDGDAVGTVKPWSGMVVPYQYAFAYGQEIIRTAYPAVYAAITSQQNTSCTAGSAVLTGLSDTTQLPIGAKIESSCFTATNGVIVSKTVSTITASINAIISTSTSVRFFPYGNGNGTSTLNLPDLRGRIVAGRDNMGGIAANRLTAAGFGISASAIGANGGTEAVTLLLANLPPYTPVGSINILLNYVNPSAYFGQVVATGGTIRTGYLANSSGASGAQSVGSQSTGSVSVVSQTFTGFPQGGTSTPVSVIQPTSTLNYVIKVLPDANPNSYFGVAAIGGMYGNIVCGVGITCAGNTISAINALLTAPTPTILGGVFQSNAPLFQFNIGVDLAGNLLYGGGSTTVNGQVCTIGASCTITASAGTITIGSTIVSSAGANALLYNNAGILGNITTISNSALLTDGSGVPSWVTGIPNSYLASMPAATLKGNPSTSTASAQDFTIQGLTALSSPDPTLSYIPIYDNVSGQIRKATPSAIASVGTLPVVLNNQILANTSGASAIPAGTSGTNWIDSAFCSTLGNMLARLSSGWVCSQNMSYVEYYGATGDGVTDDTAAIQAAENARALSTNNIKGLKFRGGTYVTSGIAINRAYGGGWYCESTCILQPNANNITLMSASGAIIGSASARQFIVDGFTFRNGGFTGTSGYVETSAFFTSLRNLTFSSLQYSMIFTGGFGASINISDIKQFGTGSWVFTPNNNTNGQQMFDINISNVVQESIGADTWTTGAFIDLYRVVSVSISNVNVRSLGGQVAGIRASGGIEGLFMSNIIFAAPKYGYQEIIGADGRYPQYVYATNFATDQATVSAISIQGFAQKWTNVNATFGNFTPPGNTGSGIEINPTACDVQISNATVRDMQNNGVNVTPYSGTQCGSTGGVANSRGVVLNNIYAFGNHTTSGTYDILLNDSAANVLMYGSSYGTIFTAGGAAVGQTCSAITAGFKTTRGIITTC